MRYLLGSMRADVPRTIGCIGYTAGLAKLSHGDGLNTPVVLVPKNAVMSPSGAPASVSAPGMVAMPALVTLIVASTSDARVMSHGSFR